ncbi:hypothetical protein JST97_30750 [bacterium]|nr:hypothetical protein [bacterium]
MAFNPMMMNPQFGGGMMPGGGGGLMGQLGRGLTDGSLVGGERNIATRAVMDEKMTEAMAKADGVITPQERMAIMAKKCKAKHILNRLRTNGMGNVSGEALARQQMGGFGGPGMGGPGFPGSFGAPAVGGPGPVGAVSQGAGSFSYSAAWSTGGTARAVAGPNGAFAQAF